MAERDRFLDIPVSRRNFLLGTAAVGGTLFLPACDKSDPRHQGVREFPTNPEQRLQLLWERPLEGFATRILSNSDTMAFYFNEKTMHGVGGGKVTKLDHETGLPQWQIPYTGSFYEQAMGIKQNLLFKSSHEVTALDLQAGKPKWGFRTRGDINTAILRDNGTVFVEERSFPYQRYLLEADTGKVVVQRRDSERTGFTTEYSNILPTFYDFSKERWMPTRFLGSYGGGFLNLDSLDHFTIPYASPSYPYPFIVKDSVALFTIHNERDKPKNKVVAFDVTNGGEIWARDGYYFAESPNLSVGSPAWHLKDLGTAVITYHADKHLYVALDGKTGEKLWERDRSTVTLNFYGDGNNFYVTGGSLDYRGGLFTRTEVSGTTAIWKIDPKTGLTLWETTVNSDTYDVASGPNQWLLAIPDQFTPIWNDENVMVMANRNSVCVLDMQKGQILGRMSYENWFETRDKANMVRNAVTNSENVYFALRRNLFVLKKKTGDLALERQFHIPIEHLVLADDFLLVGNMFNLYCYKTN